MQGIKTEFIVPDKYKTAGSLTSSTFNVPMFDYEYSIEYSYSDIAFQSESASGQKFPEYGAANNLTLISKYNFKWTGLLAAEKTFFDAFIKSFNNSFQPFTMRIYKDAVAYDNYIMIVEPDTINVSKDRFDLWGVSLILIKI
jgi:hypothetical protein